MWSKHPKSMVCIALLMSASMVGAARAELHTVSSPGGGVLDVGTLDGHPTPQQALGATLKKIDKHYGNRLQLGRGMRDPSGQTIAVFFNVQSKIPPTTVFSGLVIASAVPGKETAVAILTDEAKRFPTTFPAMLRRLQTVASESAPAQAAAGQAAALQSYRTPDGTAAMGLPAGWRVVEAGRGAVHATGPDGGLIIFGAALSVVDPRVPGAHSYMQNISTVPYTTDPVALYKALVTQTEQRMHRPAPSIQIAKVEPVPNRQNPNAWILNGSLDQHDGHGPMTLRAQVGWGPPNPQGFYTMMLYEIAAPPSSVVAQEATLTAVFKSFTTNDQLIVKQAVAQAQLAERTAQNVVAQARRTEDVMQRNVQAFSNILFNQSVVRDTEYNAHGTFNNDLSSALVESNPDRFQIVPPSEFVKGIDY